MTSFVLSHFALASPLGAGRAETVAALHDGRGGLSPCAFETVRIPTHIGEVDGLDRPVAGGLADYDCRNNRLALMALEQDGFIDAVAGARKRYGAHRIGLFAGTSTAGILETELLFRRRDPVTGALPADFHYAQTHNTYSVADFAQRVLGLAGPAFVVSAACASTAKAFGNAARMIALGLCDAAVVGGADSLCLTTLYGFHSLQLTAEGPCRPFDASRSGISIGEAAGFALLERAERAPGAISLLGIGESSDAHHMSSPHPEGLGARMAMERALAAAGLAPEDIDYINLHGTATRVGDAAEDQAIWGLFGDRTPCNSTKGQTGHTLGASGILETIIAALCLDEGFIPSSPTTERLDPTLRCRYLIQGTDRPLRRVMSNSFGFGGSNCSVILGAAP
ncbi:beta-ketoacyl-[acyl-carrier-protein] synthase II [Aliidongia dinghuensis]|uniref:Beta-ketoacyl-[acyl-carrier-protein] synthase II n=1 Tax=Aliidongia dinghuensis TaxID=1867774 RepID=A0A8J2Z101_9PROT|nr:beta-ketoacyl-[acyl-carrier-protein] synthase family protein [Aliidongia dinghuensis]GGF46816.1 beta-ketoacyl-[acyl-carrier-protein] synthase II [Aliidongia dinghuensis]